MPDPSKLPYLLKLLDDDSPVVQKALAEELSSFGPALPEAIAKLPFGLEPDQKTNLFNLLEDHQRSTLLKRWEEWAGTHGDGAAKIEAAYKILSDFQNGPFHKRDLSKQLDLLAEEYRSGNDAVDVYRLSQFLFRQKSLRGASEDTYYDPANSNLMYVLEAGRGLPISLTAIYMLLGERLGLSITGCAYPGHFLARTHFTGKIYLVDCFNGGRFVEEDLFWEEHPLPEFDDLREDVPAGLWMRRVLRNLLEAYTRAGCSKDAEVIRELLESENGGGV